jgi:glycosyltransferase involved in cell wall biosynthesis
MNTYHKNAITVIIPTYNRPTILVDTIARLHSHLLYDGEIHYRIGDDSDQNKKIDRDGLHFMANVHATEFLHVSAKPIDKECIEVVTGPKRGLGANLNMLIAEAKKKSPIILQMDDDHWLNKPLDINRHVAELLRLGNGGYAGWIRLFLGTYEDINNDDPFYKFTAHMVDGYWYPDVNGEELYIASNRPHIKHSDFHDKWYGYYLENEKLGETEAHFCHVYIDHRKKCLSEGVAPPSVAIPVDAPSFDTWSHVGDSWQKKGL